MRMDVRRMGIAAAAALGMAAWAGTASAGPIAYTFTLSPMTVVADGETFDDAAITFTLDADTGDIQEDQGNYIVSGSMRFSIAGGPGGPAGPFTIGVFSPMGSIVVESPQFRFTTTSPALVGYDLASAVAGTSPQVLLTGDFVQTQDGGLILTPGGSGLVGLTFRAGLGVAAPVPEPSALASAGIGVGVLGLAALRPRRRRV